MSTLSRLFEYDPAAPLQFTSGQFMLWFGVFFAGYLLLRESRARLTYVALFSWFLYYKASGPLVLALLFTTLSCFLIALALARTQSERARRGWLYLSIALSGGVLVYFKYTNFLLGSAAALVSRDFTPFAIALPVGISFFTFHAISYVVDVYRRRLEPTRSFVEYAAYLAYFPQLVAGPIVRAGDLLRELRQRPVLDAARVGSGLFLVLCGVVKKVMLADYLARYCDEVFGGATGLSGIETLLGVYGYALQILCDFSGYSDIALGLARLMGITLPENFRTPYAATSITDFWRRWHITLSSWLRDYIYIPLGGNRQGARRTALNVLLTMAFGGLWHGASLCFLFWGVAYGLLLCAEKALAVPLRRLHAARIGRVIAWLATFHLVVLLWIPFRAGSASACLEVLHRLTSSFELDGAFGVLAARRSLLAVMALAALAGSLNRELFERAALAFSRSPLWLRAVLTLGVLQLALEFQDSDVQPFIYFQF